MTEVQRKQLYEAYGVDNDEALIEALRGTPVGGFTQTDFDRLMKDVGFVHFKSRQHVEFIGPDTPPSAMGIIDVLIGHDNYIKEEIQEAIGCIKPIGTRFHFVDCNGYGWWA